MELNEPMCLRPGTLVGVWEPSSAQVLTDLFTIECPPKAYYTPPTPPPRLTLHATRVMTKNERRQLRRLLGNLGEPPAVQLPPPPRGYASPASKPAGTWVKVGTIAPWYSASQQERKGKSPAEGTHSEGHQATTEQESDDHHDNP